MLSRQTLAAKETNSLPSPECSGHSCGQKVINVNKYPHNGRFPLQKYTDNVVA